ncbi:MAG: hypothetical protein KQJ78_03880 [Deltaproteobacteria bacterium]|nr:hypothetical protein [Deltaproteobacteria bacterium]
METISIRLFEPANAHLVLTIFQQMDHCPAGLHQPFSAALLGNCSIPGDWTMQLTWRGDNLPPAKTALGWHLAESFRFIGLVHHSVWQGYSEKAFDHLPPSKRGEQNEV